MPERMTEEEVQQAAQVIRDSNPDGEYSGNAVTILRLCNEIDALRQEVRGLKWLTAHPCPPKGHTVADCWDSDCMSDCHAPWLAKGAPGIEEPEKK